MNQVIAFYRDTNGMLAFVGVYPTNGKCTGTRKVSAATPNNGVDPLSLVRLQVAAWTQVPYFGSQGLADL